MADKELSLIIKARDQATKTINSTMDNWKSSVMSVAAAYVSFSAIKNSLTAVIEAGMESERVWAQTAASLKRHGYTVDDNIESIQRLGKEMITAAGISDEKYGMAVQRLLDHNVKLAQTHKIIQAATDLSIAKDIDFTTAIELLGKANEGVTETLKRYGIVIDDSIAPADRLQAVLKLLNERFGGAAQKDMETAAGKLRALKLEWDELLEAIYNSSFGDKTGNVLSGITTWIHGLARQIEEYKTYGRALTVAERAMNEELAKGADEFNKKKVATQEATEAVVRYTKVGDKMHDLAVQQSKDTSYLVDLQKEYFTSIEYTSWQMGELSKVSEKYLATQAVATAGHIKGLQTIANIIKMDVSLTQTAGMARDESLKKTLKASEAAAEGMRQAFVISFDVVGNLFDDLAEKSKNVFIKMAAHFTKYFINSMLEQLATMAIGSFKGGGILGLLSKLFDTPENDAMAAQQGADFSKYFGKGAKETMEKLGLAWDIANKFSVASKGTPRYALSDPWNYESQLAARNRYMEQAYQDRYGSTNSAARALAHRLNAQLNININGNLVDDGFVQRVLIPRIEKYSRQGTSMVRTRTPITMNMGLNYGK
jgi:hypothetical protein